MSKGQMVLYAVLLLVAYAEENQVPVIPLLCLYAAKFWYGLAEYAGTMGIKAETYYFETVKVNG